MTGGAVPVPVPVHVVAAGAVSAHGFAWHGLASAPPAFAPCAALAASHGCVLGSEAPPIPEALDVEARARKLMSRPARLAAAALRLALTDAAWTADEIAAAAFYMGVGASGGATGDLESMLAASLADGAFSTPRFGDAGLAACNPLYAFSLMNNFTLCHAAIAQGVGGPNAAFFSRGTGTVAALAEAHWAIASGECSHALAGGADSALHPVTWSGLVRDGFVNAGLVPGDGAAVLALSADASAAWATLDAVELHSAGAWAEAPEALPRRLLERLSSSPATVVVAAHGDASRRRLVAAASALASTVLQLSLGEALAATPALAWAAALDLLRDGAARRAIILSAGIDGGLGGVAMTAIR